MKNGLLYLIALLCLSGIGAAVTVPKMAVSPSPVSNAARVQIVNGYYVFICSRPVNDCRRIAVIVPHDTVCHSLSDNISRVIKFLNDSVPEAQGIIVPSLQMDTIWAVKF